MLQTSLMNSRESSNLQLSHDDTEIVQYAITCQAFFFWSDVFREVDPAYLSFSLAHVPSNYKGS